MSLSFKIVANVTNNFVLLESVLNIEEVPFPWAGGKKHNVTVGKEVVMLSTIKNPCSSL